MSDDTTPKPTPRPTLSDQLARQHELLMATLSRPARTGSQSVEFGERATGAESGTMYVKSIVLVQGDDEEDVQFLGRQERALRDISAMLDKCNAPGGKPGALQGGEAT